MGVKLELYCVLSHVSIAGSVFFYSDDNMVQIEDEFAFNIECNDNE